MLYFLHIAHTGGRAIGRWLWTHYSDQSVRIHNAQEMAKVEINDDASTNIVYFVLRDPVERAYKEFLHYSRNLLTIGRVNHLDLEELRAEHGVEWNPGDPRAYFSLEVNRNVLCKFLMMRRDFSQPVTQEDLNHFKLPSNFQFDRFGDISMQDATVPILSQLVEQDVHLVKSMQISDNAVVDDPSEAMRRLIMKKNLMDVQLHAMLSKK